MVTATFRYHEELNDFLACEQRGQNFERPCARAATVKHMIEALDISPLSHRQSMHALMDRTILNLKPTPMQ